MSVVTGKLMNIVNNVKLLLQMKNHTKSIVTSLSGSQSALHRSLRLSSSIPFSMIPKEEPEQDGGGRENTAFEHDVVVVVNERAHQEPERRSERRVSIQSPDEVIMSVNDVRKMSDVDLNDNDNKPVSILRDSNFPKNNSIGIIEDDPHSPLPNSRSFVKRASISLNNVRRKSIEQVKYTFNHYKGIVLALASSVFFTLTAVIVKHLKHIHPGEMACFRFAGILLFTIPMLITANVAPFGPREKRHFLLLRGIAGATSLYLRYSALHYLPIANATVIVLSMPVFVCIFARIFLKEPCGIFHCVAIGVTFIGIGFTTKIGSLIGITESDGTDRSGEMIGLMYSMGATLVGASIYIFVRKVKEVHNSVILFNFALVAVVETSILTGLDDGFTLPTEGFTPWLLMVLCVMSFYAQLLLTKALQMEEASIVSVTRSSAEVVCAFAFQILIFHQIPDVYACIGALLVISSVLLISARKWVVTLPSNHMGRKLLGFTLR
jgi:drug/metabolite transporter (DMT)-like permease